MEWEEGAHNDPTEKTNAEKQKHLLIFFAVSITAPPHCTFCCSPSDSFLKKKRDASESAIIIKR